MVTARPPGGGSNSPLSGTTPSFLNQMDSATVRFPWRRGERGERPRASTATLDTAVGRLHGLL